MEEKSVTFGSTEEETYAHSDGHFCKAQNPKILLPWYDIQELYIPRACDLPSSNSNFMSKSPRTGPPKPAPRKNSKSKTEQNQNMKVRMSDLNHIDFFTTPQEHFVHVPGENRKVTKTETLKTTKNPVPLPRHTKSTRSNSNYCKDSEINEVEKLHSGVSTCSSERTTKIPTSKLSDSIDFGKEEADTQLLILDELGVNLTTCAHISEAVDPHYTLGMETEPVKKAALVKQESDQCLGVLSAVLAEDEKESSHQFSDKFCSISPGGKKTQTQFLCHSKSLQQSCVNDSLSDSLNGGNRNGSEVQKSLGHFTSTASLNKFEKKQQANQNSESDKKFKTIEHVTFFKNTNSKLSDKHDNNSASSIMSQKNSQGKCVVPEGNLSTLNSEHVLNTGSVDCLDVHLDPTCKTQCDGEINDKSQSNGKTYQSCDENVTLSEKNTFSPRRPGRILLKSRSFNSLCDLLTDCTCNCYCHRNETIAINGKFLENSVKSGINILPHPSVFQEKVLSVTGYAGSGQLTKINVKHARKHSIEDIRRVPSKIFCSICKPNGQRKISTQRVRNGIHRQIPRAVSAVATIPINLVPQDTDSDSESDYGIYEPIKEEQKFFNSLKLSEKFQVSENHPNQSSHNPSDKANASNHEKNNFYVQLENSIEDTCNLQNNVTITSNQTETRNWCSPDGADNYVNNDGINHSSSVCSQSVADIHSHVKDANVYEELGSTTQKNTNLSLSAVHIPLSETHTLSGKSSCRNYNESQHIDQDVSKPTSKGKLPSLPHQTRPHETIYEDPGYAVIRDCQLKKEAASLGTNSVGKSKYHVWRNCKKVHKLLIYFIPILNPFH